jgi:hypothetical protein
MSDKTCLDLMVGLGNKYPKQLLNSALAFIVFGTLSKISLSIRSCITGSGATTTGLGLIVVDVQIWSERLVV